MRRAYRACLLAVLISAAITLWGAKPVYPLYFLWREVPGSTDEAICEIAYDPVRDILYAAAGYSGIWRCSGIHTNPAWTKIGTPPADCTVSFKSLAFDAAHNVLYTGDWAG